MSALILLLVVGGVLTEARNLSSAEDAYSERCSHDLTKYWDWKTESCRPCQELEAIVAGYEFSPNCGQDDYSGTRISPHRPCLQGTYNDGSRSECQKCKICSPEQLTLMECNSTRDTQCCTKGDQVIGGRCFKMTVSTRRPTTLSTDPGSSIQSTLKTETPADVITIETPTTLMVSSTLTALSTLWNRTPYASISCIFAISTFVTAVAILFFVSKKWRRRETFQGICVRREPSDNRASLKDSLLHTETNGQTPIMLKDSEENPTTSDVKHLLPNVMEPCNILVPKIEKAPLSVLLDNLDVLEELIMLLDPEHRGTKNTRHLAAHCAFSATWVDYVYSMKDTRSPLRAVIEGVVAKLPEWTVGDLARVFAEIGRNDAVVVLCKLPISGDC